MEEKKKTFKFKTLGAVSSQGKGKGRGKVRTLSLYEDSRNTKLNAEAVVRVWIPVGKPFIKRHDKDKPKREPAVTQDKRMIVNL